MGLKSLIHKIMTWGEVGHLTHWATQVPVGDIFKISNESRHLLNNAAFQADFEKYFAYFESEISKTKGLSNKLMCGFFSPLPSEDIYLLKA